jgi:signal transduction histidine kinase
MSVLSSLTNRIFLASALLVVVAMAVVIYRVNVSVAAQAENDLQSGLAESASLVDQVSRRTFADFVVKGSLIAVLPTLGAAAQTRHPPTVQPLAVEYQRTIGADLFAVLATDGTVLARAGRIEVDDATLGRMLTYCATTRDGTCFWPFPGGLLHVAAIALEQPFGTLVIGTSLDRDAATLITTLTNSEIAFVSGDRIVATSLSPARAAGLGRVDPAAGIVTRWLGDEEYIGRAVSLAPDDEPAGPVALVLRSRTEHLRFLARLHWQIALTGLAAVLGATLLGYLVARTVTRPLRALTGAMREMAATGDLARTLPALGRRDDEDVRLVATTFHQLTSALDRFQREAALRERLSSLGRLSTVVAHEIRNPLMIIKSTARTLRRHQSPDVAAAASSIDEEVARLNRVVTGVLDFARPIRFERSHADLAAICRDAVQAVRASDDVAIGLEVPAEPVPIDTDAERLRSVLVNVLNNAQQAVRERAPAASADPPVSLRLTRGTDHQWQIVVADRGGGIAADDLPRIFEPFFTTRRGGSGLGLPISRNIIEGLGGTMTVESERGLGTTVTVTMTAAAPASQEQP